MNSDPVAAQYDKAFRDFRRQGASHAHGPALAAMYAQLIADLHGGEPSRYFQAVLRKNDKDTQKRAKILLSDRAKAWDALLGIGV